MHAQFGEQLSRLHAMVEDLSRHGRIDHLLPDLPGELVPTYAQLLEAEVPEVLARRLRADMRLAGELVVTTAATLVPPPADTG